MRNLQTSICYFGAYMKISAIEFSHCQKCPVPIKNNRTIDHHLYQLSIPCLEKLIFLLLYKYWPPKTTLSLMYQHRAAKNPTSTAARRLWIHFYPITNPPRNTSHIFKMHFKDKNEMLLQLSAIP